MLKKIKNLLIRHNYAFLLGFISVILCWVNYEPGSILSGWDTLHPEFDLGLNLNRVLSGVWREEQGLGALAGHSHMSELPRILFLYISSFVFPAEFLRYLFFFACLILGPLGMYTFIYQAAPKDNRYITKEISAFGGGLLYLLNLGTLQHFYVPFEMFATMYAFLPWLFLYALKFIYEDHKKNLLIFTILSFLAAPMAYAATLWYVYFLCLSVFCLALIQVGKKSLKRLSRVGLILLATLAINSYWLLPQIYHVKTSAPLVAEAKSNQMFSLNAYDYDGKFATPENVALLKAFLFDWREYNGGQYKDLLDEWKNHINSPIPWVAGWLIFAVIVVGLYSSIKRKNDINLGVGLTGLVALIFILHGTFPLSALFNYLRDNGDILKEGLRFPWTKFSIIVIFAYAYFFSRGIYFLQNKIKNPLFSKTLSVSLIIFLTTVWMLPAFQGNLISKSMKVNIPQEYFETYRWFKDQPKSGRIAFMPSPTFYGWEYYKWGFEGAGFIWFGLNQPVLTRDFDRWAPYNENFYWESSYALSINDPELFYQVLQKYKVEHILLDKNIINPSSPQSLSLEKLEQYLSEGNYTFEMQSENIKVFKVNNTLNNIYELSDAPVVNPIYNWSNLDNVYQKLGSYISFLDSEEKSNIYFPFRSLFTGKQQDQKEFEVVDQGDYFLFSNPTPKHLSTETSPILYPDQQLQFVEPNNLENKQHLFTNVYYKQNRIYVEVPKVWGYYSADIDLSGDLTNKLAQSVKDCADRDGIVKNQIVKSGERVFLRLIAKDALNCGVAFNIDRLPHNLPYLITIEHKNKAGRGLLFWLENETSDKSDIEVYLPTDKQWTKSYIIVPPMAEDGVGYSLHFDNSSIGSRETINDIGRISINTMPYNFLLDLNLVSQDLPKENQKISEVNYKKVNPSLYDVTVKGSERESTLVLPQSYHSGWSAFYSNNQLFPFFGEKLKSHVLVNNWANGWILDEARSDNKRVIIVFWPQYLQYLGFILAGGWIIGMIAWRLKK